MASFEKKFDIKAEDTFEDKAETYGEKMERFVCEIADRLRSEGLPLGNDCRLNPELEFFTDFISENEIKRDQKIVKNYQKEWYGSSDVVEKEIKKQKRETSGEKLEMLKTVIFNKFLGDRFITIRTSLYDDIVNKIDNVLVDRESGNVVCAVDEIEDTTSGLLESKKEKILERNREGGGKLKYGIGLRKNAKEGLGFMAEEFTDIPIFCLALDYKRMESVIKYLESSVSISEPERKLFEYFIRSMEAQVEELEKKDLRFSGPMKKRLGAFRFILPAIKKKYKI